MAEAIQLLVVTVLLRPYAFLFLAFYLTAASVAIGWRRTALLTGLAWVVASLAEYSSTRTGIPFGVYSYISDTKGRELWISNVPFMDALSLAFLAYVSFTLAQWLRLPVGASEREVTAVRRSWPILVLTAFVFMLIDTAIELVALRGDHWFLGEIYEYPEPGFFFSVPLTNFFGWAITGFVTIASFQQIDRGLAAEPTLDQGVTDPVWRHALLPDPGLLTS
ncbi:carotenoid biosynthesis protein [Candidatus Methylomirabilis sp.]|uniref:Carotenoid biosynthesis protein n=1 Tax=Candidatus Methylomirabilis tolerans TaxID=3123416 RepID=A0AAJ1EIT0_9BACT|nr:carotenoid biosynthesis protein [Candidatus Methylomirabilis sp.]